MENGQSAESTGAGELASFLWETGVTLFEDIEEYLASERGAQVRRALAIGLITGAPLIVKLPVVKNTPLGRLLVFAGGAALIVMLIVAPLTGSGFLCLRLGLFAPVVVALFHLAYGAILGAIYGKLIDTDEARDHLAHHAHR